VPDESTRLATPDIDALFQEQAVESDR